MRKGGFSEQVKAIFFDYGGTLDSCGIAWKEHFWPIYLKYGRKLGVNFELESFVEAFYRSDDSLVDEGNPGLSLTEIVHEQVRRVLENLNVQHPELAEAVSEEFVASSKKAIDAAMPVLELLKRHFRLGIISNNYGNLPEICRETRLDAVMDVMIDSRVVGAIKPSPEIFRAGLDALGVDASEAVMVGDSFPRDVEGALGMGMKAVWIVPEEMRKKAEKRVHDYRRADIPVICSISELSSILLEQS